MVQVHALPELLSRNETAISAACRRFGVARLDVFGSILTPDFHDGNDVDFVVLFREEIKYGYF